MFHIGRARVRILMGDVSEQDTDAIAIAANDRLWMSGTIANAVKQKAGEDVETLAMKQGPAPIGSVVVTDGGGLNAKFLMHVVIMGQDIKTSYDNIKEGVISLVRKSDELGLASISMPALGTDVAKFPAHEAAKSIIDGIIDSLLDAENIREIRIVLRNEGIYKTFVQEFERQFSR